MPRKQPRRGATRRIDLPRYTKEHPNFAMCRVLTHSWELAGALESRNGQVVWPLRCVRCKTKRHLSTNRLNGLVERSAYKHQPGYLFTGVGRQGPTIAELRVAMFAQLMGKKR